MGTCFWDEFYCNGIISQHTTTSQGVKIQTYAGAEWQTIATESNKRQRRAGGILLEIDQSLTPTAVATTANDANSIKLDNKTQYGAVMATARGANGQFFIQGGTNSAMQAAQAASTSGTQQTIISTGLLRLHSTSSVNMSGHSGISFTMQNETEYAGFGMSKITNAADNYNGALPTTGKNLMLVPTTVDMGRSIQIGSGNGAQKRWAGLFVRGLDIGEGGSLTTTSAENGRGIAMVGATPKWAAAQSSAVSDNYPRGGILIGIRGDGAETSSDARRIQILNESNNGRIDIYAQPNVANGNTSTINIIQGKGASGSPNPGIRIAGSGLVEIASANSNVTVQAQAAGSSFAVNVGSEAQPQILVTKTTTTIRNLALANVQATDKGNIGTLAPFGCDITPGLFTGQQNRVAGYHATATSTAAGFAPHSSVKYSHNGGATGSYSWGVENMGAASPGRFAFHHVSSDGSNESKMTWDGQSNILVVKDIVTTGGLTVSGNLSANVANIGTGGFASTGPAIISNANPVVRLAPTSAKTAFLQNQGNAFQILRSAGNNGATNDAGPNSRHPMVLNLDTGDVTFSGNITAYSDARLKKEVKDLGYGLDEILKLRPVSFKRIGEDTDRTEMGFIAQEVREVMPEIVIEAQDEEKTLTMSYDKMVAPLVRAIQEQQDMINKLMSRVEELEKGGV